MKTKELIAEALKEVETEIRQIEQELDEKTTLLNGCEDEEERYHLTKDIELKKRRLTALASKRIAMIDYIEK